MLETRPPDSPGRVAGLILASLLLLLAVGLTLLLFSQPITLLSFLWGAAIILSLPAVVMIAAFAVGLRRARYYLEGSTLLIEWGPLRHVIPAGDIEALTLGRSRRLADFRGLRWPGVMLGWGSLEDADGRPRPAVIYATRPPAEQLFVLTPDLAFGLSPPDPEEFKSALEALRHTAVSSPLEPAYATRLGPLAWDLWGDRWALRAIGLALAANALLFAYLAAMHGRLPAEVPLHFGPAGTPDRWGAPSGLFILPLIGFIAWGIGLLVGWFFHQVRQERPIAAVVWGATLWVQLATWVAAASLLG